MKRPGRPSGRVIVVGALASVLLATGAYAVTTEDGDGEPAGSAATSPLVGSWELVSFSAQAEDGRVLHPLGESAEGMLTYTSDGHVSVALWRPGREPFAAKDQQQGTAAEYAAAVRSLIQYVGTYSVDALAGTVSAVVDQSVFPNWNGTTQLRHFKVEANGDRLLLTSPPFPFGATTIVASVVAERA